MVLDLRREHLRSRVKLETAFAESMRERAFVQLMRVPWNRFRPAYEAYIDWNSLALWVNALGAAEGCQSSAVSSVLRKRCPEFIKGREHGKGAPILDLALREWIHNQIFRTPKRECWLDALIYYSVRSPLSRGAFACWERLSEEWKAAHVARYPTFAEWSRLARNQRLIRSAIACELQRLVEAYVDWSAFGTWLYGYRGSDALLERRALKELEQLYPRFLDRHRGPIAERPSARGTKTQNLMLQIEERLFQEAKSNGWFEYLREQSHWHPRHLRTLAYGKYWAKQSGSSRTGDYPSFARWRRMADSFVRPG